MADGSVSDSHDWRREGVVGNGDGDGSGRRSGSLGGAGAIEIQEGGASGGSRSLTPPLSLPIGYKFRMFLGFYAVLHMRGTLLTGCSRWTDKWDPCFSYRGNFIILG